MSRRLHQHCCRLRCMHCLRCWNLQSKCCIQRLHIVSSGYFPHCNCSHVHICVCRMRRRLLLHRCGFNCCMSQCVCSRNISAWQCELELRYILHAVPRWKVPGSRGADGLPAVPSRLCVIRNLSHVLVYLLCLFARTVRFFLWNVVLHGLPGRLLRERLWSFRVPAVSRWIHNKISGCVGCVFLRSSSIMCGIGICVDQKRGEIVRCNVSRFFTRFEITNHCCIRHIFVKLAI